MMRWLLGPSLFLLIGWQVMAGPPTFPPNTQFLCRIDAASFVSSDVIRKDIEPWKALVGEFRMGLNAVGINPDQVEKVWIACGDDFPKSLAVVVEGTFETAKLEPNWQRLVRDRQFNFKVVKDADSVGYSLDLSPTAFPIPGLPKSIVLTSAGPKSVAFGITKEHLFEISAPTSGAARPALESQLVNDAAFSLAWKLPGVMTGPNALLTGANQLTGVVKASTDLACEIRITADSADACRNLAESFRVGTDQLQRVFPPLARQQGVDPRIIRVVTALATAAKNDVEQNTTIVKSQLAGDEVKKLLTKP